MMRAKTENMVKRWKEQRWPFGLQAAAALGDRLKGAAVTFVNHDPGLNSTMDMASPSFKMRFMYMAG